MHPIHSFSVCAISRALCCWGRVTESGSAPILSITIMPSSTNLMPPSRLQSADVSALHHDCDRLDNCDMVEVRVVGVRLEASQ